MIRRYHFFIAAALIVSTSGFLVAQNQHKNRARGFNSNGVYSAGDIDHINLFNGNLTALIPIGQSYPVNGQLSYAFNLVYNSNPWSPREVCSSAIDQDTHFSSFFTIEPRVVKFLFNGGTYKLVIQAVNQTPGGDPYDVAGIEPSSSNCWTIQDPNPAANAGLGWQLSFGKLYKPRDSDLDERPNYTEKSQWVYMEPDGSEHTFYPTLHEDDPDGSSNIWYTRDSSYLRLNMSPPANVYGGDMMIEFPNGQKHYFKNVLIRKADSAHQLAEIWEEKLSAIVDQFDNYMKIEYLDKDGDDLKDDEWVVTDSVGRSHQVTFAKKVDGYQKVVTEISLQGFGGSSVSYKFAYESNVDVNRPAPHITHELIPESTDTLKVPLLTAVKLPNGSQYAMPVDPLNLSTAAYDVPGVESTMTGLLGKIVLPTGGQIEWKYRAENPTADQQAGYGYKYGYGAAARHFLRRTIGVRRRIVTINKGAPTENTYTWKYDPKVGDNYPAGCQQSTLQSTCSPAEIVNKVTTPDCDANNNCSYTLNYFSIWPYPYGGEGVSLDALKREKSDLHGSDYALPFTKDPRAQSDTGRPSRTIADVNGDPLFLSQAIFDKSGVLKRSVYVRYESDVLALNDGYGQGFDANTRTVALRTVYHDDAAVFAETQYHDFDGLGHYRQQELFGSFGSGDRRLDIVWYNRANGSYSVNPATNQRTTTYTPVSEATPWLLETYDSKISSDFSNYRSTAYFSFNAKGMIQARRTLRDFETPGAVYKLTAKDHLTLYGYDASGNLTSESYYGGDKKANVSTAAAFSASGASEYSITTSYRCGDKSSTVTTSVPSYASYTGNPTPSLVDETVDCSTGLISTSKDTAGVKTSYQYDGLSRLTRVIPQDGAITKVTYFDLTDSATTDSPYINVEYLAQDPSFTPMGDEVYKYDQLGRLFEQHQRMPGVGTATAVYQKKSFAYNGMGWTTAESEWSDGETNDGRQTKYENFDPFGRPSKITAADGSVKQVNYNGVRLVTKTVKVGTQVNAGASVTIGQEDATTVEAYDRQGRIWIVREQSGVAGANVYTTYSYNVNGQIVSATTPAQMSNGLSVTQTRGFTYDNLGHLRSEILPEISNRTYDNYDTLGNVGSEFTGKSNLRYTYDFAGRLTLLEEQNGGQYRPLKDYIFYTSSTSSNYSLGKLQTARRYNWVVNPYQPGDTAELGVVVREDFTYGGIDGRLNKTTTTLNADKDTNHTPNLNAYTFDQTFTYDARGNVTSQTYPQCTNTTCTSTSGAARPWRTNYAYQNNRLVNIGGGAGTGNTDDLRYASAIRYYANGMLKNVVHGNGTRDLFDLDPNYIARQSKLTVQTGAGSQLWTSGTYSYDGTGNITRIGSDWFAYDKVGRVVEGTVLDSGGNKRKYTYDAFGNVTSYLTYNGITPSGGNPLLLENFITNSQPSSNRLLLNYDAAGNAIGLVGQAPLYTYDAVNMVKYAPGFTYLYASDDERIWSVDKSAPSAPDTTWFEDSLPAGAVPDGSFEGWNWTSVNPSPFAGSLQHQSLNLSGIHQHFFTKATTTMKVAPGGSVFAYVYIDPQSPPSEIMLQWDDGSGTWAHRAFWGADQIAWGTPGTTSPDHNFRGALPPAGSWQRLELPAAAVGLENVTVSGMAFTLFGGKASWDHAGQKSSAVVETISLRGLGNEVLREYQVKGGDGVNHWAWVKDNIYSGSNLLASETPQGVRHYHLDHLGTPKLITDAAGNPLAGAPYVNFPFGEETSAYQPFDSHVPPPDEKLRFTGQEKNQDYSTLGLYYMHARYYLPGSAKFLSIDPGKDITPLKPQTWNLYSYVANNPVNATDPDGRAGIDFGKNSCTTPDPVDAVMAVVSPAYLRNKTSRYTISLLLQEAHNAWATPAQAAAILAQVMIESRMGNLSVEVWNPSQVPEQKSYQGKASHWNWMPGDGYNLRGHGDVQFTGRKNMLLGGNMLGLGDDLVKDPAKAADPAVAARGAVQGMMSGLFTGAKLSDYVNANKTDFYNVRKVVNGIKPKVAREGQKNAKLYLEALTKSGWK